MHQLTLKLDVDDLDPKPSPLQHTLRQCEISGFDVQDDIPLRIPQEDVDTLTELGGEREQRNNKRNRSRQGSRGRVSSLSPEYTCVIRNKANDNSLLEMISEIDSSTVNDWSSPGALKIYKDKQARLNTEPDLEPEISQGILKNCKYDQYQEAFEERLERLNMNLNMDQKKDKRMPQLRKLNSAPDNKLQFRRQSVQAPNGSSNYIKSAEEIIKDKFTNRRSAQHPLAKNVSKCLIN